MKKAITIVLVALMLVAMLAACSAKNPTTPTVETTVPPTTMAPTEPSTPVETTVPPTTEAPTEPSTEPAPETQPITDQDKVQPTEPKFEPKLTLSSVKLTMKVGQSTNLSVSYVGGTRTLTWKSSNTKVATVKNGKVTAKAPGKATITVTDGSLSAKCEVTVYGEEKPAEYTLKVSPDNMTLTAGQTGNIAYEYTGTGKLTWKSGNESVATVSNGKVTALKAGTAVISLTDGKKTSQCVVTVKAPATDPKPTEPKPTLSLNKTEMSKKVGESETLKATYTGKKTLSWSSSNSAIASVDKNNGKVTARAAGTAVITVTDGNLTAQCVVTVTNKPGTVAKLSLNKDKLSLEVGATSTLKATYTGSGSLTWTSSNTAVATVSNGKVTALKAGTATITVKDGKLEAKCVVTVTAPPPAETEPAVGELTIKTAAGTAIYVGESLQIEYTYTGDKSALTWKSNDTSILTVNSSGKVTGVAAGETRVAVYHGDTMVGRIRLVVAEKVVETEPAKPKAEKVIADSFTGPYFEGTSGVVGNYMTFKSTAKTSGDNQAVTATSSNSGVVSVERTDVIGSNRCTFKVKFKGAGTATITITSEDGNASKSYTITVKSSYSSARSGQLSPEEFVSCVNGIMRENGAKISTSMGYLVETLSADKLTGSNARSFAEAYVRDFWPDGIRSMGMSYQGVNEDGNHVFYIHR